MSASVSDTQRWQPSQSEMPPNVLFSGQVKKIGFDGSSLPRLVVVTDTVLYVCLRSGGITRSIDTEKVEYLSISTTGDGSHDDAPIDDHCEEPVCDSTPQSVVSSSSKKGGSSRGGATPEKIAERIRRRFQRKKIQEGVAKARSHTAGGDASRAAAPLSEDVSMIIATIGVTGEVALVLRFQTDDDAVAFASAMEQIADESHTPIRFHLPQEMSAKTSARTSSARSATVSPTRPLTRPPHAEPVDEEVNAQRAKPEVEAAVPPPETARDELVLSQPPPLAPPSASSGVEDRLQRWRQRGGDGPSSSQPQPPSAQRGREEARALPPRSYFSAATFGTRPRSTTADALVREETEPAEQARGRPQTPTPDSTEVDSLPSSSNSTSAPPSPVPLQRARSRTRSKEQAGTHNATITAALSAARRSEDARRTEPTPAILEPLVHSSAPTHDAKEADDSAAYELELSPEAPTPLQPNSSQPVSVPVSNDAAMSAGMRQNDNVYKAKDEVEQSKEVEIKPSDSISIYHQLYDASVSSRARRHRSRSRDEEKPRLSSRNSEKSQRDEEGEEGKEDEGEEAVDCDRGDAHPRPGVPPSRARPLSGLNESHHNHHQCHASPDEPPAGPVRSSRSSPSIPLSFRTPAPSSATEDKIARLLRIDEGLAEEMLSAREEARAAETARQEAEARLRERDGALRELERALEVMQGQHEKAMAKHAQTHRAELRDVQEAFDTYDKRMSAFLDKLQSEHEADATLWLAERQTLKAVIKAKEEEVARMAQLLAAATANRKEARPPSPRPVETAVVVEPKRAVVQPARQHPPRAVPAYLDAVRGYPGVDDSRVLFAAPADYYEEAHSHLQAKLAKYTHRVQGHTRARRPEPEPYDLDEDVAAAEETRSTSFAAPQRTIRTPPVRTASQPHERAAGGRGRGGLPLSSMHRATTRTLQYPNDNDDAEDVGDMPVDARRTRHRTSQRLMSPSRD